jgi:hypothetical protein
MFIRDVHIAKGVPKYSWRCLAINELCEFAGNGTISSILEIRTALPNTHCEGLRMFVSREEMSEGWGTYKAWTWEDLEMGGLNALARKSDGS